MLEKLKSAHTESAVFLACAACWVGGECYRIDKCVIYEHLNMFVTIFAAVFCVVGVTEVTYFIFKCGQMCCQGFFMRLL